MQIERLGRDISELFRNKPTEVGDKLLDNLPKPLRILTSDILKVRELLPETLLSDEESKIINKACMT